MLYVRDMAWLRVTALKLKDLGVPSASTVQQAWTVATNQMPHGCAAVCFENHSFRLHGNGYTILEDFVEYLHDFEVKEVRSKRPAPFPTEQFTELQSAIFDTFVSERSEGRVLAKLYGVELSMPVSIQRMRTGRQRKKLGTR